MSFLQSAHGSEDTRIKVLEWGGKITIILAWCFALYAFAVRMHFVPAAPMPILGLSNWIAVILSLISLILWLIFVRSTSEEDDRDSPGNLIFAVASLVTFVVFLVATIVTLMLHG